MRTLTELVHPKANHHSRAFLNLWFAKPMVCMRVAFHENNRNHEHDENDEDNSDSYKEELSAGFAEIIGVATPAEPRGEDKHCFVQILGGEKLLKFVEKCQ